jgi:hypothetical protein
MQVSAGLYFKDLLRHTGSHASPWKIAFSKKSSD